LIGGVHEELGIGDDQQGVARPREGQDWAVRAAKDHLTAPGLDFRGNAPDVGPWRSAFGAGSRVLDRRADLVQLGDRNLADDRFVAGLFLGTTCAVLSED